MRLIDADKLKDWLWSEPLYHDSINDRTDIREHIDNMPTVYNLDKVLEQLGNEEEKAYSLKDSGGYHAYGKAYKIVKAGGINE